MGWIKKLAIYVAVHQLNENYSAISVESHVGKGVIIDDYGEMIYNPWTTFGEMNISDLQDMKDATIVSAESQAQIIPYIGAKHAVMFGGESAFLELALVLLM